MQRWWRLDGNESHERHSCGIADKHHDLYADVYRQRRYVRGSQYYGSNECEPRASQRPVRIGKWRASVVRAFDQSLFNRHGIERRGCWSVDMELCWF
jgi:hypothetical protein